MDDLDKFDGELRRAYFRPVRPGPNCTRAEFLAYSLELDTWQKRTGRR